MMIAHYVRGRTVYPEDVAEIVLGGRFEIEKRIGRGGWRWCS